MSIILKLIISLPLLSSILNGLFCKKVSNRFSGLIASIAIILTAFCAWYVFYVVAVERETQHIIIAKWIDTELFSVNWGLYVDQLTAIMFLLVTTVSAVVHVYSLGYMSNDENLPKFLSYLSLFTFFMLVLVSADNFLQLFFGWEGVGLCSYLLIGYYYKKASANKAAIKAFVINRASDFAFIIGIVMIVLYTGTLDYTQVFALSSNLSATPFMFLGMNFSIMDVICMMLFIGCMGKSAQIGLHTWLPDAMEGPTPVSALIHAATMVTAGVFLVTRCSFLFEYSPLTLQFITIVGAVTCLFAALIAITQTDIKKIIAYSTCSQLGYMFFACGVSAYQAGIFHLFTHGFFKALLFLSAGSVIHSCSDEQDVFKIGGIRKKMPITYANFWVGTLAIVGIFPFAGFYSKDLILESAYGAGNLGEFAFIIGIIAAMFTAIYSLKIIMLTFHGKTKLSDKVFNHVHESPRIMNAPLLVLVFGALFSGMLGYYILNISSLNGLFAGNILNLHQHHDHNTNRGIDMMPLIFGITGILFGIYIYKGKLSEKIANTMKYSYLVLKNKFFFDEIYNCIFVNSTQKISLLSGKFDTKVIDRFGPNGISTIIRGFSWSICKIQTGYIFNYAFYIIFALIICLTIFVIKYLFGA